MSGSATSGSDYQAVASSVFIPAGQTSAQLTINKATASVTLSDLDVIYDGMAKAATVTTNPAGLAVTACLVGSERAATRVEVARAPVVADVTLSETGSAPGCAGDPPERPPRPWPGAAWIEPDCRFDGVRYEWHAGRWETARSTGAR